MEATADTLYLLLKWMCSIILRSFVKDLTVINEERIPLYGPVIFVGNHNNQFLDASMLIGVLPRRLRFLIAAKSMRRRLIGLFARAAGCIPVKRQTDLSYESVGTITWTARSCVARSTSDATPEKLELETRMESTDLASIDEDTGSRRRRLRRGDNAKRAMEFPGCTELLSEDACMIQGIGTRFLIDLAKGYKMTVKTDSSSISFVVKTILTDTEVIVESPIEESCPDPDGGVKFTIVPKVDQTDVYDTVVDSLKAGETIGIFPEGGSHDRTTLLPLKPGVAVMALCSVLEGAEDVMIVPVGLSYNQVEKFQCRATVDIGVPIVVTEDKADAYERDRREGTNKLLVEVEEGLQNCVLTAADHQTMEYIRLCSSLFPPERLRCTNARYYALNQRFSRIFWRFGEHSQVVELKHKLRTYTSHLKRYPLVDSEVWHLKQSTTGASLSLVEKLGSLFLAIIFGLPLSILWGPLGLVAKAFAEKHRQKAVAESRVKIRGDDVLASYKILVLMVLLPTVNVLYGLLFGCILFDSIKHILCVILFSVSVLPVFYFISMRYVDKINPLCRQIKTLIFVITGKINVWRDTERELITDRIEAQLMVRKMVQEFGPKISDTFLEEFYVLVPKLVLESDTKRLKQKRVEWSPINMKRHHESREEIL